MKLAVVIVRLKAGESPLMYNRAYVFALSAKGECILAGEMETSSLKGTFQYSREWLNHPASYPLDPVNLPLTPQRYHVHNLKNTFAVFSDAGPDSWGERIFLQHHHSLPKNEVERLLRLSGMGVGSLQFSLSRTRPKMPQKLPTMDLLSRLSHITEHLILKQTLTDNELQLLDPGSSMGGARPKVTVCDGKSEWLVKFSRPDDLIDNPRVEYASMQMLATLGINTPETKLITLDQGKSAYLIKRFDRIPNKPVHFISAHSLFNTDRVRLIPDAHHDPRSYIALARHLRAHSAEPTRDCQELYRRMVANVLLGNTDDHARNHAMLYDINACQWQLAPAYDMLPILGSSGTQALGVGIQGRASTIENLLSASTAFGLSREAALTCIHHLSEGMAGWQEMFLQYGVCEADIAVLRLVILNLDH
jgi:serine/threonine-protein kinase HipA